MHAKNKLILRKLAFVFYKQYMLFVGKIIGL